MSFPPARIYLSSPDMTDRERSALLRAFDEGWIAPIGPDIDAFEVEIAKRCGRGYGVALSSGTAALHLALLEAGARPGTVVIVPTMTFAATANAAYYTGAQLVFVDCDAESGNLSVTLLAEAVKELLSDGESIAAVVPVDLLGRCADYAAIQAVAEPVGIPVVADSAESLGAHYAGKNAGEFGVSAAVSFNGNKVMTTSGGGALVTDDEQLARRVKYLSTQARQPVGHYEHTEVGYNYRLSNLLAALGRAQLSRLDDMIARRRAIRDHYADLFAPVPGVAVFQRDGDENDNCWLTSIVVDPQESGWAPRDLAAALDAENIESRPLWKPMHLQPVFAGYRSFIDGSAEMLFERGLTLPSGSVLGATEVRRIDSAIERFLSR